MKNNKDDDLIKEARRLFQLAIETEQENRDNAKADIEFALLSKQWSEEDVEKRRRKGKPCLTINKLPTHIRQVVNDARQNKPAIKINPIDNGADPETAEILTGLIRNIENNSKSDIAYDTCINQAVSSGYGFWRVNVEYAYDDTFDQDIVIDRIPNQFSVYGDPYSTSADGSDWNVCFVTDRLTKKEFQSRYKGKDTAGTWEGADGYDELEAPWADEESILIAEYWVREEIERMICLLSNGDVIDSDLYQERAELYEAISIVKTQERLTKSYKVTQYIISGKEVLETNEWAGKYIPIVPCYGEEVICEGKRTFKSLIRDAKDAQRQFNFWITSATESASRSTKAPWIGKTGTFNSSSRKWATANTEDHAFIEYDGNEPPIPTPERGLNAAEMQMAMTSGDNIQSTMGMFNASLGQASNETSGKAIIARQRESDTGSFHFIDNLSRAIRHTGCIIVDLIPHVYSGERVIRVLGEDKKESKSVQLGQQQKDIDSVTGEEIIKIYDLSIGKYDVTVTAGASYTTQRQEAASQMIELMRVNPNAAPLIGDLLAKNLDWPGADEISERFKAMLPPQITGENLQIQQLQQQIQQMQHQAQQALGQLQQQIQQLEQDKQIDVAKVEIDAYKAETDRAKILQTGMTPEQTQILIMQTLQQLLQTPDVTPQFNDIMPQQELQPQQGMQQ